MARPRSYRLRLTTSSGIVDLAPTTYRQAREDAQNRVRLAELGSSVADVVDILVLDDGAWLPHTRCWMRNPPRAQS